MPQLADDLRFGARLLLRSRGFTFTAILALALGIGANTAIFSVVDAVLVRPLPYPEAGRLVMVWEDVSKIGFPQNTPAPANWMDWKTRNTVFVDIAATRGGSYNLTGDGPPEQINGRRVTASFWSVLGTTPAIGRVFTEKEDEAKAPVAVLTYGLWQRRFGADPNVLGRGILLNGQRFEVIGVMPQGFAYGGRRSELFTPISFTAEEKAVRGSHFLTCVGRLKPGVSLEQAQSQMNSIAGQMKQENPGENQNIGVVLVPIRDQMLGNTRVALIALLIAAGCVLLIACANVANLLLARGIQRQREFALRIALGAGRGRLLMQLTTESLLLSVLGALAGLGVARLSLRALEKLLPTGMAPTTLTIDTRLLIFTCVVAVAAGLLFGVAPALAAAWMNAHDVLKQGGRGSAGSRSHLLRDGLVVSQVALALLLLAGAGLMIRTLAHYQSIDPGFRTDHLLTVSTSFPQAKYDKHPKQVAFVNGVLARVRAIPGVRSADYTSALPLITQGNTSGYILEGQTEKETSTQDALFRVMTPGYLETIGAQLREGRFFTTADHEQAPPVVLVNETLANRHWRGQSAVGKRLKIGRRGPEIPWSTVAGVVKEIRDRGINIDTKPAVYVAHAQGANAWPVPQSLVVRTSGDPNQIVNSIRQAVWAVDPDQPVADVRTMEEVSELETAGRRQTMFLLGAFAALSLLLAMIGVYGVLSYSVSQRVKEIGVRIALGASRSGILRLIALRGLLLALVGTAVGLAAALAASRYLESLLFGVAPRDFATLAGVSALLLAVVSVASLVPAFRATLIDPAISLREE